MNYENADGYKIRDQDAYHFLTFTVVGWIDIFSRQCYRDIIINSFKYCQEHKGLKIGAWVIMSNHIHVIWKAQHNNLSDVIRDFKTFTSKAISKQINQSAMRNILFRIYYFGACNSFIKCNIVPL